MESCPNSNSSKLLWLVFLLAKMKKIHPKMKVLEWSQHISHCKSMEVFQDAQVHGRILPNFKPIRDLLDFLNACKNEEDPIKNEGARVVITLSINFSEAQGQVTPKSVKESCRNSN